MRRFSSYGPVDIEENFAVKRKELVARCVEQLVGTNPDKGGHYFTMWGPRQTGKTWIMRQAVEAIRAQYGDKFIVGVMTLQSVVDPDEKRPMTTFLHEGAILIDEAFGIDVPAVATFSDWRRLFAKKRQVFDRPVILLMDEFDSLPPKLIDRLVATFRKMYLSRDRYWLHGLALIGVRAVLGVDSPRGSPFNVQRSLQIPNLTRDEVVDMYQQYQSESGQAIEQDVVQAVFDSTRGQPGLVSWFGELLTEKYNTSKDKPITMETWSNVYEAALHVEWNNMLLNLSKKARGPYRTEVMRLFTDPNVPFSMEEDWCHFLYTNGIIDPSLSPNEMPMRGHVCRFSSPFVQMRLYSALTTDMFGGKGPLQAIEFTDLLTDVFTPEGINAPKLLERYRGYLKRLKAKGIDPWVGQPRRADLQLTEAVGHFHLYAWLRDAVGRRCTISPEFPTGNGRVDLYLSTTEHTAIIEVKSLRDLWELEGYRKQAAHYAKQLGLPHATLVVFAPVEDDAVLTTLMGEEEHDGVRVTTVPFGWV